MYGQCSDNMGRTCIAGVCVCTPIKYLIVPFSTGQEIEKNYLFERFEECVSV